MERNNHSNFLVYGFDAPNFVDLEDYSEYANEYDQILNRRRSRWNHYYISKIPQRGARFKRFCRKGIPAQYRPQIWMHLSGADKMLYQNPGVYQAAASKQPPSKLLNVILADVPRTFPENVFFRDPDNPKSKLKSLERLLSAFAVQFPQIGYCQGMNYIAATLLLVLFGSLEEIEEQAFWIMDALFNRMLPPYYSSDMLQVKVDCMVFEELLRIKVPDVHRIIINTGINCTLLATKWFICLFADVLPVETTLRIFDCLFYEGDKILFRACLALVKLHHQDLLKCNDFPVLITAFRNMCRDKQTLYCHQFVESMFSLPGRLPKAQISKLRHQFRQQLSNQQK